MPLILITSQNQSVNPSCYKLGLVISVSYRSPLRIHSPGFRDGLHPSSSGTIFFFFRIYNAMTSRAGCRIGFRLETLFSTPRGFEDTLTKATGSESPYRLNRHTLHVGETNSRSAETGNVL